MSELEKIEQQIGMKRSELEDTHSNVQKVWFYPLSLSISVYLSLSLSNVCIYINIFFYRVLSLSSPVQGDTANGAGEGNIPREVSTPSKEKKFQRGTSSK